MITAAVASFILVFSLQAQNEGANYKEVAEATKLEATSEDKAKDDSDEVICRRISVTGSRLKKRKMCGTKAEWEQMGEGAGESVRNLQRGGSQTTGPSD